MSENNKYQFFFILIFLVLIKIIKVRIIMKLFKVKIQINKKKIILIMKTMK